MKKINFHFLLCGIILFVSCASNKDSNKPIPEPAPIFPDQEAQAKLSKDFEQNPEGQKNFGHFLKNKSKHPTAVICVENEHDNIRFWSLYPSNEPTKPFAIMMQPQHHRYLCAAVSDQNVPYRLKLEAYGKSGIYACEIKVKAGEHIKVHSKKHSLVCGSIHGHKLKT